MINFELVKNNNTIYIDKNLLGNLNIFQTSPWLQFISEIQNAEPIIAVVKSDDDFLGYFTSLITDRFGLKILGSPFRGWLTYFMGFNLLPNAPKNEILRALPKFAFEELGCHYLEVIDPHLKLGDWVDLSYKVEHLHYYGIDISKSEDDLFNAMESPGRRAIRKSIKNGVFIEEASDIYFADEYYSQYKNVLSKQGLSPTYSLNSVRKLLEYLLPTGNLLLLRARSPEGACIATGIFLSLNKIGVVWGVASWSQYQHLRPNEPIVWYAMRKLKTRGIQLLNYGGKSEHFKEKLGAYELQLYRLMNTKYKLLGNIIYPLLSPKNEVYRNFLLKRISP
jgi:lipid II:glycine glycyltransferase (peptidoglycan interpeptide bridge formation enzyme)